MADLEWLLEQIETGPEGPTVGAFFDFDGTLSPGNMQEFGFIQAIGKTPDEFWRMSDGLLPSRYAMLRKLR